MSRTETEAGGIAAGTSGDWEAVIGLEVHAQLLTRSKMFCGCSTAYLAAQPNSNVCPLCLGLPGVLPVINAAAVEMTVITGLTLGCEIPPASKFDRKNYFYPDLPKGYQISQYDQPLCLGGYVDVPSGDGVRRVGITRIHLEEDTGKLLHGGDSLHGGLGSSVDLNRAGVPLMEIVSEPDLRTAEEASTYMQSLRDLLRWIGVSDGNLEEGSIRCDANVSVRRRGAAELGVKAEVKNMNSFRAVQRAVAYEISRQIAVLEDGGEILQETRGWVDGEGRTVSQRSKEYAHDYRYFPEPDLPPMAIAADWVEARRAALPELPGARAARLARDHGLGDRDAAQLTADRDLADYFEAVLAAGAPAKPAANWILGDLAARLKESPGGIRASRISASGLASLVRLIEAGTISGKMAKQVFADAWTEGVDPAVLVERGGLAQVSDEGELRLVVTRVLAANPQALADYRGGNQRALGALVGAVMRETAGRANPSEVNRLLLQVAEEGPDGSQN